MSTNHVEVGVLVSIIKTLKARKYGCAGPTMPRRTGDENGCPSDNQKVGGAMEGNQQVDPHQGSRWQRSGDKHKKISIFDTKCVYIYISFIRAPLMSVPNVVTQTKNKMVQS